MTTRRARPWGGLAATLLVLILPAAAPEGQYLDGRGLLALCARHEVDDAALSDALLIQDLISTGTCRGYLMGVADQLESGRDTGACVPDTTTVRELLAAARGLAARNPGLLGEPASRLVARALRQAYPCPIPPTKQRGR